jgi:hypothetical protein
MIFSDFITHVKNDSLFLNFYNENKEEVLTFILSEKDFNKSEILDDLYIETIYPGMIGRTLYIDFRISLFNFLTTIINDYGIKSRQKLKRFLDSNGLEIKFLNNSELKLYTSTVDTIFNDR